jgi:hypothetical protein
MEAVGSFETLTSSCQNAWLYIIDIVESGGRKFLETLVSS